jgi:hypothetical protein
MSFWSIQGAQRATALLAMLLVFTYQLEDQVDAQPVVNGAADAPAATPAQEEGEEDRPGLNAYFCLLACAVLIARQIRKRGNTHITLS